MASSSGPTLAHTRVASIRSAPTQGHAAPSTPHTPPRTITSTYASPSTIRADDDIIIIELGSRFIRAGFAGDSVPKATLSCGPEEQRRVGDFRTWQQPGRSRNKDACSDDYQLWRHHLYKIWKDDERDFDVGLFQDKLDRMLREAFSKYLLVDSRPRRAGLVLDSEVPLPILSSALDILFHKFQTPIISLMSSATMSAVSAGVRSALVVDLGWNETVVTSIYEYREVRSTRTVRGGKSLVESIDKMLRGIIQHDETDNDREPGQCASFEECEDVLCRLMWCRCSASRSSQRQSAQLETVEEQDENEADAGHTSHAPPPPQTAQIPLHSAGTLEVPFEKLADVCDDALFAVGSDCFDDHELPLPLLVYQHLLQLPMDVRAVCMPRILFTGGCSKILGVKERIMDEVTTIVQRRGWGPVTGKGVDQLRHNPHLRRQGSPPQATEVASEAAALDVEESTVAMDGLSVAANAEPEHDPIEAKVARNRPTATQVQGELRAIHSLGAWTGGSLLCQLKVPAMATIDRELWLQQGASGASRPSDVDMKAQQRQSVGAGGLIRGSGGHHTNWTLGAWGAF